RSTLFPYTTLFRSVDPRVLAALVAEGDRVRGTGGLAGRHHLAFGNRAIVFFGIAARAADALNAIRTLLHDAARAHGNVRVVRCLDRIGAEVGIFLAIG